MSSLSCVCSAGVGRRASLSLAARSFCRSIFLSMSRTSCFNSSSSSLR